MQDLKVKRLFTPHFYNNIKDNPQECKEELFSLMPTKTDEVVSGETSFFSDAFTGEDMNENVELRFQDCINNYPVKDGAVDFLSLIGIKPELKSAILRYIKYIIGNRNKTSLTSAQATEILDTCTKLYMEICEVM